ATLGRADGTARGGAFAGGWSLLCRAPCFEAIHRPGPLGPGRYRRNKSVDGTSVNRHHVGGAMRSVSVRREVSMSGQTYQSKPWGTLDVVARAHSSAMAPCSTATRSFRNDHGIGWLLGTGGDSPG